VKFGPLGAEFHPRALLRLVDARHVEAEPQAEGSDRHGQLVERDRQPSVGRLLDRELVVSTTNVLDERMPGDDHPSAAVLLESAQRMQSRFSLSWSHSSRLLAYRSVRCQAIGSSSSTTAGYTGA
jgi:hypothetical protein